MRAQEVRRLEATKARSSADLLSPTDKAHAHLRAKSLSGGGLASHGGAALSAQHKAQLHKASRLIDAYASCLGTCWLAMRPRPYH